MNGKQLKEWAAKVPDDAMIEKRDRYNEWAALEPGQLKATMVLHLADANFTPVEK